jgi:hypothetical protein
MRLILQMNIGCLHFHSPDLLADAGGFVAYAPNFIDQYREAAVYVHKILQGANPANLPVFQPTKLSLEAIRKAALRIRRAPRRPAVFPILKVSAQTVCLRSLHTPSSHVLAVGPSRELVLLVLIFAHFKVVHFFDQQLNYHSSFGFV